MSETISSDPVITDVGSQLWPFVKERYGGQMKIWGTVLVIWELGWAAFFIFSASFFQISFFVLLVPLLAVWAWYGSRRKQLEGIFFDQFATANNFTYSDNGQVEDLDGALFKIGHSGRSYNIIAGKYQELPLDLFNYSYTVGSGKNQRTYSYSIFRLIYPTPLPPLFLQLKHHDFGEDIFMKFDSGDSQQVHLDANLDSVFTLWATRGFEMEALQIFEQDFTQKLADEWKSFSLQFVNNHLYIYSYQVISREDDLLNLYSLAKYLTDQLKPRLEKMKGDILAVESYQKN